MRLTFYQPCDTLFAGGDKMSEYLIPVSIKHLEEGGYLATSQVLQGLIAQGRTIAETLEIAEDVARRLIESRIEHKEPIPAQLVLKKAHPNKFETQIPVPLEQ
jgi:predicted RNase H-like HicB family nuclease